MCVLPLHPETIVAAVAANTSWKSHAACVGTELHSNELNAPESDGTNHPLVPMNALPAPNIMAKPIAQYAMEPIEKSIRFFMRMLTAFLARVNPDSTIANPACIKKTRNAATSTHNVSAIYFASETFSPSIDPFKAKTFRLNRQVRTKTTMNHLFLHLKYLLVSIFP